MSLRGGGLCEDVSLYKPSSEITLKIYVKDTS